MAIKLIALDLDGTTLNSRKELSPRTRKALCDACSSGVAVVPTTGRPRSGLPTEILSIPGIRYAVTSNGASVYDLRQQKELFVHPVDKDAALWALDAADGLKAVTDIYLSGEAYTAAENFERLLEIVPPELKEYCRATRIRVPRQHDWLAAETRPVEKLTLFFGSLQDRDKAWEFFLRCGRFEVASSVTNNLELNQRQVDKGLALTVLAEHLGLRREECMACGDSFNDIPMLRTAGLGIAMGNAEPETRQAADRITDTNDNDGVAKAVETYVLGCGGV